MPPPQSGCSVDVKVKSEVKVEARHGCTDGQWLGLGHVGQIVDIQDVTVVGRQNVDEEVKGGLEEELEMVLELELE